MTNNGGDGTVDVTLLRAELDSLLDRYGLGPGALLLVPSVHKWALSKGLVEENPWRLAIAFPTVGGIAMKSPLPAKFLNQTTTILHLGPDKYEWVTASDSRAVKHLLLHEVAHLRGILEERAADEWAYNELLAVEAS